MQASGVPCSTDSIDEMITLLDVSRTGLITWRAFESFLMHELAGGASLFEGEYLLPSGQALPFGVMLAAMKRKRLMNNVMQARKIACRSKESVPKCP